MGRATRATTALERGGIAHRVHAYAHDVRSTAYGDEAVAALCSALDVAPERVLKTLVLVVDDAPVVAVLPVGDQVDPRAVAAALGGRRAGMAEKDLARRATGYVLGGVSPLGQRRALPTVVHVGVLVHPSVLCSAGQRGLEVELDPAELVRATGAVTAAITRG